MAEKYDSVGRNLFIFTVSNPQSRLIEHSGKYQDPGEKNRATYFEQHGLASLDENLLEYAQHLHKSSIRNIATQRWEYQQSNDQGVFTLRVIDRGFVQLLHNSASGEGYFITLPTSASLIDSSSGADIALLGENAKGISFNRNPQEAATMINHFIENVFTK